MNLQGKKVIILGGSSGIGLATAKAAAAKGVSVIIVSSNQERINIALKDLPAGSEGYAVDLSKEENIEALFSKTGNFDHLVYCAGENLTLNTINATDIDQARSFFNLRFWGPFAAVKYGVPFLNKGGSISLTSGTANARPGAGWSVASAICGAMEGFVRAMAVELAPVRVNCVVPGVVKTPLWDSMPEADREGLYKYVSDSVLLKRVAEAEDIARGFIYLMEQDHATGQSLLIDGGTVLV
ncbi:SDR family oxidoreductase [Mucilaginibacter sp. X4EP1]|jgi:NAD(P)-dependent dehydrogenase (short-subunit alcohol dehydrogenase family)|uniref:SDR family oxidoreductase n=1 Tax=Mucilaginibacter sp. X4EP1 TaxID=2723092 RepID=UPI0021674986|nr:SDR family oxidoreductase [Mucilaginibacter sp. X4EP1]MCS3812682.1 NAD(P)-dependent dehydrogenase (short-subunit alcohol dehydrogenase family) [Mucilaginibacter sp. X4EP1]